MSSSIVYSTRSTSQEQPDMRRVIEKAGQTFLIGTPIMIDTATGAVQAWDGTTIAGGIAGFTKENGANLTTTGVPQSISYGGVPNQPLAVNIPAGVPINDGRNGFETSVSTTIFAGQVGPAQTAIATDIGKQYGMTKDTDGHWYVDKTKSTAGTNTVCTIVKLDQFDNRGVQFVVSPAAQQIVY